MPSKNQWAIPAALALLAFLVFSGALGNGFVNWDDHVYVVSNVLIRQFNASTLYEIFRAPYFLNWAPLTILSYAIDRVLWGPGPFGYHLTNLFLHALCTVLLYALLCRLLSNDRSGDERIPAALAAILFAVHSVQVESVAWISERKNLLSMAFFLGAFLAWLRASRERFRPGASLAFLALLTASLLAKAHAVVLPPLLLVYEWLRPSEPRRGGASWQRRAALLFAATVLAVWVGWINLRIQNVQANPRLTGDLLGALATAPVLVLGYLQDLVFPMNRAAILPRTVYGTPWEPAPLIAWLLLLGWTTGAITLRRRCWQMAFFSSWYLLALAPVLNFIPLPLLAADRYQYWACPGFFALAGIGAYKAWLRLRPALRPPAFAAGAAIAIMLATLSAHRVLVWKDSLSLWKDTAGRAPQQLIARSAFSGALYEAGNFEEAVREARAAVTIARQDPLARPFLEEAESWLETTEAAYEEWGKIMPPDVADRSTRGDLGLALFKLGRLEEAARQWSLILKIDPHNIDAYNNIGMALLELGKHQQAEMALRESLWWVPGQTRTRVNLARVLMELARFEEAERELREAWRLDPSNTLPVHDLACLASERGDMEEALSWLNRLIAMGYQDVRALRADPCFSPIKQEPRFTALLGKMRGEPQ